MTIMHSCDWQAHNRNTQMKKDRDNLFEQLRHVEVKQGLLTSTKFAMNVILIAAQGVCKAERHLPGADDVLAILASSTHEF